MFTSDGESSGVGGNMLIAGQVKLSKKERKRLEQEFNEMKSMFATMTKEELDEWADSIDRAFDIEYNKLHQN